MQYIGSKNRIAKYILPVVLKDKKPNQWYVEPFVGGANCIDKVFGKNRLGNDNNYYLIELLKAIRDGWQPPTEVSKEEYYEIKKFKEEYMPKLVGFVGFLCSFGCKWWGGYAFNKKERNYTLRGYNNLMKQAKNLKGIVFTNKDYKILEIPNNSIVYCDPPYRNTTKYSNNKNFDYNSFYSWCCNKQKEGHTVYISEYYMPEEHFECILNINHRTILKKDTNNIKTIEKLFKVK